MHLSGAMCAAMSQNKASTETEQSKGEIMTKDGELLSILYVSSAKRLLSEVELAALLESARAHNAECGITGLLLYGDGNFMQLLEGPEAAVTELYERIRCDSRHHMVITIQRETGLPREFADWSMAYRPVDAPTWLRLSHAVGVDGQAQPLSAIKQALQAFWRSVA